MKYLITAIIICASNFLFAQSSGDINVNISGQTTREELNQMRKDLHQQGIVFSYSPQFDQERRLTGLKYKFTTTDQVLLGEGEHMSLQQSGANVHIQVNPVTKNFSEEKNIAPSRQ
jgi:hypothetical protein